MSLSVDEARRLLRDAKLRCTPTRIAVLQHLSKASQPVTHAEVATALAPRGMDKSTVYRFLVEAAEVGIASRLELGDHTWRFELRRTVPESEPNAHPHFVCVDCGKVTCLPTASVQVANKALGPSKTPRHVTEVLLKGHCEECS